MSYKTEFQSNNFDLQNLIDLANSLPVQEDLNPELTTQDNLIAQITTSLSRKIIENLDEELEEQDDLIAQIAAALEGKTGVGGNSNLETFTLTLNFIATSFDGTTPADAVEIELAYHGFDETNEFKYIEKTVSTGASITIQCLKNSFIYLSSDPIEGSWGDMIYPGISTTLGAFISQGTDSSIVAVQIFQGGDLTFTVMV